MPDNQRMPGHPSWFDTEENGPFGSLVSAFQCPPCAWCLCEQGAALGNGSHGICPQHADKILRHYRERRARRQVK